MFRPKKHLKLDLLKTTPSINDLEHTLGHARKLRGSTIELPWDLEKAHASFALAVRIEVGSEEAYWTLYTGYGDKSHVVWSAPFTDVSLLHEVLSLSITEIVGVDEDAEAYRRTQDKLRKTQLEDNDVRIVETPFIEEKKEEKKQEKPRPTEKGTPLSTPYSASNSDFNTGYSQASNSQVNTGAQPVYPNFNPNATGGFPAVPPQAVQPPMPYVYYYPGYPYPIPMPYPPAMPMPQPVANSVPLQQGMPVVDPNASSTRLPAPDADLLRKHTNYMIGQLLVDSRLISETTLTKALKLQEMVVGNVISVEQAHEAINNLHNKGASLDVGQLIKESPTKGNTKNAPKQNYPLLGDLLVKGHVLSQALLDAVLKMQEIVRAGAITKDEACQEIIKELAKNAPKKPTAARVEFEKELRVIDLLIRCSLITSADKETALAVQKKHGGQLGQILVSAGKLHLKTYLAAIEGEFLLRQSKIKLEQVIIALNYCARTRMNLPDAIKDLGFLEQQ